MDIKSVINDLEAIATGMTGDLTPANVANIALAKLTTPEPLGELEGLRQQVAALTKELETARRNIQHVIDSAPVNEPTIGDDHGNLWSYAYTFYRIAEIFDAERKAALKS